MGCFMCLTFQLNFKNCFFFFSFQPLPDLYKTPTSSEPRRCQYRKYFIKRGWYFSGNPVTWAFGKPECGRLILETLSLSRHSGPCKWFRSLTPGWAAVIGGPKKGVLKWKRGAGVLFPQPAGCLITFLLWLLFPTFPPGLECFMLPSGDLVFEGHPERMLLR